MIKIINLTNGTLLLSNGIRLKRSETREFGEDTALLLEFNKLFSEKKIQILKVKADTVDMMLDSIQGVKNSGELIKETVAKVMDKKFKFKRKW